MILFLKLWSSFSSYFTEVSFTSEVESEGQRNKESKSASIIVEFSVSLSHTHTVLTIPSLCFQPLSELMVVLRWENLSFSCMFNWKDAAFCPLLPLTFSPSNATLNGSPPQPAALVALSVHKYDYLWYQVVLLYCFYCTAQEDPIKKKHFLLLLLSLIGT